MIRISLIIFFFTSIILGLLAVSHSMAPIIIRLGAYEIEFSLIVFVCLAIVLLIILFYLSRFLRLIFYTPNQIFNIVKNRIEKNKLEKLNESICLYEEGRYNEAKDNFLKSEIVIANFSPVISNIFKWKIVSKTNDAVIQDQALVDLLKDKSTKNLANKYLALQKMKSQEYKSALDLLKEVNGSNFYKARCSFELDLIEDAKKYVEKAYKAQEITLEQRNKVIAYCLLHQSKLEKESKTRKKFLVEAIELNPDDRSIISELILAIEDKKDLLMLLKKTWVKSANFDLLLNMAKISQDNAQLIDDLVKELCELNSSEIAKYICISALTSSGLRKKANELYQALNDGYIKNAAYNICNQYYEITKLEVMMQIAELILENEQSKNSTINPFS